MKGGWVLWNRFHRNPTSRMTADKKKEKGIWKQRSSRSYLKKEEFLVSFGHPVHRQSKDNRLLLAVNLSKKMKNSSYVTHRLFLRNLPVKEFCYLRTLNLTAAMWIDHRFAAAGRAGLKERIIPCHVHSLWLRIYPGKISYLLEGPDKSHQSYGCKLIR